MNTTPDLHTPNISGTSPRAYSLDALRGFAILTMVLSGVVPYGVLPAWMYHAQIPPPTHSFNPNLPGLTWVDLVFPFFLFAMGMAIPLALGKLINKGQSKLSLTWHILGRGFLLGAFAIILPHLRPDKMSGLPGYLTQTLGVLGFILLFAVFMRFPDNWPPAIKRSVRISGWTAVILMLTLLTYSDGSSFSLYRNNIILVVLTNVYVFGSLIWLFTRNNLLLRLGVLGILLGFRLVHTEPGWVQWLWDFSPIPWIYKLYYLQYLFIVLPGTMIGDLYISFMNKIPSQTSTVKNWPVYKQHALFILGLIFIVLMLAGFQNRWLWQTFIITAVLGGIGLGLTSRPISETDKFLAGLFRWGLYFLVLGCVFESFEGGIKKDKSTLAYYFITTGLAIMLINSFYILSEILQKKRWLQVLIDNGQNPMIAYVGIGHFILPMLNILYLNNWLNELTAQPWLGFIRALVYTILLALMVQFFTRRKIFWRT